VSLHYLVKYVDWQFRVVGAGRRALVDVIACVCGRLLPAYASLVYFWHQQRLQATGVASVG